MSSLYRPKGRKVWMLKYVDAQGRTKRVSTGTDQRSIAEIKKGDVLRDVELAKLGIETHVETRSETLAQIIIDLGSHMRAQGRGDPHITDTTETLARIIDLTKAKTIGDLTSEVISRALIAYGEGKAQRTRNKARGFLMTLFRWLIKRGRWNTNPVEMIERLKETDKKEFRALALEELQRFLEAAPFHRRVVYLLAAHTGLRKNELRTLTWSDLDLTAGVLRLRRCNTKTKKEATLPLSDEAKAILEAWRELRPGLPSAQVFETVPRNQTFDSDLERAGIEKETPEGRLDFHGLRRTFCTNLARSGVSLTQAQRLMRHSTPALTANTYTRLGCADGRDAIQKMQERLDEERSQNSAKKKRKGG